jgi:uncharacterized protein
VERRVKQRRSAAIAIVRRSTFDAPSAFVRRSLSSGLAIVIVVSVVSGFSRTLSAQPPTPQLTQPVHDFANVIDAQTEQELDRMIRSLQAATGDAVVVVTVDTIEPYADAREYAVALFENRGRGVGERGRDNGLLILLAMKERRVEIEVGYGLEEWITDGFAGETARDYMASEFRAGRYGAGLLAGTGRIVRRIAERRNVTLEGVELPAERETETPQLPFGLVITILILFVLMSRTFSRPRRGMRRWGRGGWSGWSSGVGPFGGGWTGGGWSRGGGGGFGGGFGGFGGGRSGGGGGGAGW